MAGSISVKLTAPYTGFAMQYWAEQLVPAIAAEKEVAGAMEDPIDFDCLNITEYPTTTEMLRGAGLGQVDVSHTAITMTSARGSTFNLDFTHTWFVSGFRVLARERTDIVSVTFVVFRVLGQAVGLFLCVIVTFTLAGGLVLVPLEECSKGPVRAWPEHGSELKKFRAAMSITVLAMFGRQAVEPAGIFVRPAILFF